MRHVPELDTSGRNFTWQKPVEGYSLIDATHEPDFIARIVFRDRPLAGLALRTEPMRPPESVRTREEMAAWHDSVVSSYSPSGVPGLHRKFAACESTPEAALAFCNKYGLPEHALTRPYFLSEFYAAQQMIRDALARKRKSVEAFNANTSDFWLRFDGKTVAVMPRSLLGFMLLATFREMRGSEWRDCEICGNPFEVHDARQDRQRFCSPKCRQKHFRDSRR